MFDVSDNTHPNFNIEQTLLKYEALRNDSFRKWNEICSTVDISSRFDLICKYKQALIDYAWLIIGNIDAFLPEQQREVQDFCKNEITRCNDEAETLVMKFMQDKVLSKLAEMSSLYRR